MYHDEDSISGSSSEGSGPKQLKRNTTYVLEAVFTDTGEQSALQTQKPSPLRKRMISLERRFSGSSGNKIQVQAKAHAITRQEDMAIDH